MHIGFFVTMRKKFVKKVSKKKRCTSFLIRGSPAFFKRAYEELTRRKLSKKLHHVHEFREKVTFFYEDQMESFFIPYERDMTSTMYLEKIFRICNDNLIDQDVSLKEKEYWQMFDPKNNSVLLPFDENKEVLLNKGRNDTEYVFILNTTRIKDHVENKYIVMIHDHPSEDDPIVTATGVKGVISVEDGHYVFESPIERRKLHRVGTNWMNHLNFGDVHDFDDAFLCGSQVPRVVVPRYGQQVAFSEDKGPVAKSIDESYAVCVKNFESMLTHENDDHLFKCMLAELTAYDLMVMENTLFQDDKKFPLFKDQLLRLPWNVTENAFKIARREALPLHPGNQRPTDVIDCLRADEHDVSRDRKDRLLRDVAKEYIDDQIGIHEKEKNIYDSEDLERLKRWSKKEMKKKSLRRIKNPEGARIYFWKIDRIFGNRIEVTKSPASFDRVEIDSTRAFKASDFINFSDILHTLKQHI